MKRVPNGGVVLALVLTLFLALLVQANGMNQSEAKLTSDAVASNPYLPSKCSPDRNGALELAHDLTFQVINASVQTNLQILFHFLAAALASDVFWIAVGSVGGMLALVLIYYQVKMSRDIAAVDFLLKSEAEFWSERMRKDRSALMKIIKANPRDFQAMAKHMDALNFFEGIGLLLKKKVIPIEYIWSSYSYRVLRYYPLLKDYVVWLRELDDDPTYYEDFEQLYGRMLMFEEKKRRRKIEMTEEHLHDFVKEEMEV